MHPGQRLAAKWSTVPATGLYRDERFFPSFLALGKIELVLDLVVREYVYIINRCRHMFSIVHA